MRALVATLVFALAAALPAPAAAAQEAPALDAAAADVQETPATPATPAAGEALDEGDSTRLSTAVEIAVLLTVLSLLPAALITITSFTRIVIVLSFVRRALSVNEMPPNPVIIGLALFLTAFIMAPVAGRIHEKAWTPYQTGELAAGEATATAWGELAGFLAANTRESEVELFTEIAGGGVTYAAEGDVEAPPRDELPVQVLVPAFVLSELKTAFQMGFLLFLPFLVIDLVVSSVLLSMGMFMLPPVMISTPVKILVFVLVDGWHLVCESVVTSFAS